MRVLSLFDGMACGLQALKEAGIPVEIYYASEIDKYAIQIAQKNHPEIIQLGDVRNRREWNLGEIDLVMGGSPCQDLSIAGKRAGLEGARSGLFRDFVDIIKHYKPKRFLLENVASMSKENKAIITEAMGVEPILINSALVTAQNRKRLYWTNISRITQPEDKGIVIKDILEEEVEEKYYLSNEVFEKLKSFESNARLTDVNDKGPTLNTMQGGHRQPKILWNKYNDRIMDEKSGTIGCYNGLTNKQGQMVIEPKIFNRHWERTGERGDGRQHQNKLFTLDSGCGRDQLVDRIRKLTPTECERLQGLPDGYSEGVSNTQRYKMIGNGRTIPVISHIFSFIPLDK